ncbi:MAG TPA: hypothetical protein VF752_17215 [Thermoleophilaceae bacterium]
MEFALAATGVIVVLAIVFILIGHFYPGSGADVLDWRPTRSFDEEARLELEDIDQMLEAQNERRRRSGRPELSEAGIQAEVDSERRAMLERGERYRGSEEGPTPPPQSDG